MTDYLTIPKVAEALGVSRATVQRLIKQGKIKAVKANPLAGLTSPYLIPTSELARILKLRKTGGGGK